MADGLKVGLIYGIGELSQSIQEQKIGARLALEYTGELWHQSKIALAMIERQVTGELSSVDDAARQLVHEDGCGALLGALAVPLSIRAAEWAEREGILYMAANNNQKVRDGRHYVFHIGVPSEITARAVTRYLHAELKKSRAYILHTGGDFQVHAANCTMQAMLQRQMAVEKVEMGEDTPGDQRLLKQVRAWSPEAICILGSETERLSRLVKTAHHIGGLPLMIHPRGLLCREFAELSGEAADGHYFTDLYLRDKDAPDEEKALHRSLEKLNSNLVSTASHGFGWDGLRLLAEAWRAAGPDSHEQVAFLESLRGYSGATGRLTFTEKDHNGRALHDPTTIAQLRGRRFIIVSRLGR